MEFPSELRFRIEQLFSGRDIKTLTASAEAISARYRSESGSGKRLVSAGRDVLAYAAVRMPATFGAVSRALELTLEQWTGDISSILDVGAGTGAASHAAELVTGCDDITCIEREKEMIALGSELMSARALDAQWIQADITSGELTRHADLVISSYCLNELSPSARKNALLKLWSAADKLLLIVEPGTPEGYSQLKAARELLLQQGGHIAAPCPHENSCPLPEDDWCHFTARVARSKLHKQLKGGDAPYEDEKFSFLAIVREPCTGAARILRHPKIESGRITLRLCMPTGVSDIVVTKKSALFKAARKSDCGDTFSQN
ncbi:MAG: methyltransferase domain-containing protein [Oscillospiraceae bacterium]|nr:methyltransferase domain-containing protein [Oscillospiraceae bacterium]